MNTLQKEILCTLGPVSRNERVISRLEDLGVSLFRINLSHTSVEDLPTVIKTIQNFASIPICLDTEGAQVRTAKLKTDYIEVKENNYLHIASEVIIGDEERISLYPTDVVDTLKIGDIISIDFNSVLVQVIDKNKHGWVTRVITGGKIGNNKAVSIDRDVPLHPLTQKDKDSIQIGLNLGIKHFALSFANKKEDVELIRELVGERNFVISKIETLTGIRNIDGISKRSDALLLDRGDLSRQLPIEQIPRAQKEIINIAKQNHVKCYVATNLLESMCTQPNPTRAEVNDIFNTLADGADGLVLAAETAIGKYPVQCAQMVNKLIQQFSEYSNHAPFSVDKIIRQNPYLLVDPHGGILVNRIASGEEVEEWKNLPKIQISVSDLMNVEQIAIGTYSPLEGFLTKKEVESVIDVYTLPNGTIWTLPITLQTGEEQLKGIGVGDQVALCLEGSDEIYACLDISERFSFDLDEFAQKVFLTKDQSHPGVRLLYEGGSSFLAGKIKMAKRLPSDLKHYEITPKQARFIFENKHWTRVLGFHTRNVVHRAHEYIQNLGYKNAHCDGIFIHPLVGPKKSGDYSPEVILKSYEMIVEKHFPHKGALIAAFQSYPRYAGPREAVFTAICRKNFGCSHMVVGRDHSGVGKFYAHDASKKLFIELGNIGIKPIFFDEVNYCKKCKQHTQGCEHDDENILRISGTEGREMIEKLEIPPEWFMRKEISGYLINGIKEGTEIFIK
ncbi:MAG: sulfate adenylyltransferase [Nitrospina sp.]|nr:sulfate adenylyltransferase [Nitrospina sp.]